MATLNISELEQIEKFRHLQSTLRDRWKTIELFDNSEADIIIIPSLSIDQRELQKIEGCEHYEERLLFSL
ncbi:MAG: peptide ligase PGM1-related protein, partial [Nostoc sp.]